MKVSLKDYLTAIRNSTKQKIIQAEQHKSHLQTTDQDELLAKKQEQERFKTQSMILPKSSYKPDSHKEIQGNLSLSTVFHKQTKPQQESQVQAFKRMRSHTIQNPQPFEPPKHQKLETIQQIHTKHPKTHIQPRRRRFSECLEFNPIKHEPKKVNYFQKFQAMKQSLGL